MRNLLSLHNMVFLGIMLLAQVMCVPEGDKVTDFPEQVLDVNWYSGNLFNDERTS